MTEKKKLTGRPPLPDNQKKKQVSIKLAYDVRCLLDKCDNKAQTIEKAVRQYFGVS